MTVTKDRIERVELHHIDVPLPTPLFPTWMPDHAMDAFSATLLIVSTRDGLQGVATGPAMGHERSGLGEFIGPFLVGLNPFDVDAARDRLRQSSYLGWRNNWMDVAFWDLAAQAEGVPLYQFLAARLGAQEHSPPESVQTFATFQEERAARSRAEAIERALRHGFKGAQIGVHQATEEADLKHLRAARAAAGSAELSVHAHQGWSISLVRSVPRWNIDRAQRFLMEAAELEYRWVQEPLHEENWEGIERLNRQANLPIAGGDLAVSGAQLRHFARSRYYDLLTPSCAFAGLGRLEIAMKAALDFDVGFSPMSYGDGIELLAHLHALVAWAQLRPQAELRLAYPWEPPAMMPEYRDALFQTPLVVEEGALATPTAAGLGAVINPSALRRFGTQFYELTPVRLMVSSARRSGVRQTEAISNRSHHGLGASLEDSKGED